MRVFTVFLVLIFSFQSWTKAEDIRDFEIEGMSIGDSLLDFFKKDQIEKEKNSEYVYAYKDNKFMKLGVGYGEEFILVKKIDNYDDLSVVIKPDDKNYIIHSIQGRIFCDTDINDCFFKQKQILSELKDFFNNTVKLKSFEDPHSIDKTGESIVSGSDFIFENTEANIGVSVYDWSDKITKEKEWYDNLKVDISSEEYVNFLRYEAYN